METKYHDLSRILKVLADPRRLEIFNLLMKGTHCNCEIGESLHLPPNLVSHHLSVLRESGLVDVERDLIDARWIYYSVKMKGMEELKEVFNDFFNIERIQPRRLSCGPKLMAHHGKNLLELEK